VEMPWYGKNIYSAGDFVIAAGVLLAAVQGLLLVVTPARSPDARRREADPA